MTDFERAASIGTTLSICTSALERAHPLRTHPWHATFRKTVSAPSSDTSPTRTIHGSDDSSRSGGSPLGEYYPFEREPWGLRLPVQAVAEVIAVVTTVASFASCGFSMGTLKKLRLSHAKQSAYLTSFFCSNLLTIIGAGRCPPILLVLDLRSPTRCHNPGVACGCDCAPFQPCGILLTTTYMSEPHLQTQNSYLIPPLQQANCLGLGRSQRCLYLADHNYRRKKPTPLDRKTRSNERSPPILPILPTLKKNHKHAQARSTAEALPSGAVRVCDSVWACRRRQIIFSSDLQMISAVLLFLECLDFHPPPSVYERMAIDLSQQSLSHQYYYSSRAATFSAPLFPPNLFESNGRIERTTFGGN
ncbi:hypothetical protein BCR34DRAFT_662941 [Clohesyomyces aquaticus]|uniref:Uncharacterized protein n=1 Tax=Clohesyomyces aquaticus TaxID=1231657 RepID=A0A1Y1ZVZ0_9PLEO|nr:hypothetical protein BCR34DRAFT_662941 [Clohesyomyces aquaticus]